MNLKLTQTLYDCDPRYTGRTVIITKLDNDTVQVRSKLGNVSSVRRDRIHANAQRRSGYATIMPDTHKETAAATTEVAHGHHHDPQ